MTMKEQPLVNAASRGVGIPIPASPVFAGMITVVAVSLIGSVLMLFQTFGRGSVLPLEVYQSARTGTLSGFGLFFCVGLIAMAQNAKFGDDAEPTTAPFYLSAFLLMAAVVVLGAVFNGTIESALDGLPPLQGNWH